ncbi:MAG: hypothetical protein J5J00_09560 [Deltaproteobacteria bacterium]|nr:hypothetical protein [Deltaproteobacteria bacterium]
MVLSVFRVLLLCCGFLLALQGCSPKVSIAPAAEGGELQTLAVLPPEYNAKLQREKVEAIRDSLETELRNRGFVVLADRLVDELCSSPQCPERSQLAERYQVDGFVSLDLRSVSRANFLAGYYNAIRGIMTISDVNATSLVSVEHTQSERGGLLFHSGQVFQGLISQVENTEEKSFQRLSAKFAETLASKVPKPQALETNAVTVAIESTSVKRIQPQLFEICIDATPNSLGSVLINNRRSTLREIANGRYCGTFFLDRSIVENHIMAELRSPFGNAVRKEISSLPELEVCDLDNKVFVKKAGQNSRIEVACTKVDKRPVIDGSLCGSNIQDCSKDKLFVFRSPTRLGPYLKVAEVRSPVWTDSARSGKAFYQVVAVSPSGVWSLPEDASEPKEKK